MTREDDLRVLWYTVHDRLRDWVSPFVSIPLGRRLASQACGLWVRNAADGKVPTTCAYALAYEAMRHVFSQEPGMDMLGVPAVLDGPLPMTTSMVPYQMSKVYVDIWKAAQLLHWPKQLINRASKGVSESWPWGAHQWAALDGDNIGPLVGPLARRAVDVLDGHECLDCDVCAEAALRWEAEDRRTEEWKTAQRLSREE